MMKGGNQKSDRGSGVIFVTLALALVMATALFFFRNAQKFLFLSSVNVDQISASYQMEAGYELSIAKLQRAINNISLDGKLALHANGPSAEDFVAIANQYGSDSAGALTFLAHIVETQGMDSNGNKITGHEFADFATAFPTTWTDLDPDDDEYVEVKFTFSAVPPDVNIGSPPAQIVFEYEYQLSVRGYGSAHFSEITAEDAGVFTITLQGKPFSKFALFRSENTNQNGWLLVFAGGNTSSQIREVFNGPVHMNSKPYFFGKPVFNSKFTSTESEGNWWQGSDVEYPCCAVFNDSSAGNATAIEMPDNIFNTIRLAAGDQGPSPQTNNATVTDSELVDFLRHHAGNSFDGSVTEAPNGIYIPVNDQTSLNPTGGIYVEGDAKIQLDVVQGASEFNASYWNNIQASHQTCKFQKVSVDHLDGSVEGKDVFIGDDPCYVTYVFNSSDHNEAPVLLNGRINGNIHVNGEVNELGGTSRSRPAIATDFSFNLSAEKDIRIISDIQYEDAEYVTYDSDGNLGSTVVANPKGEVGSSGYSPTSGDIAPKIDPDSQTLLGLMSISKSVLIHVDAPPNLNLHSAIYAGSDDYYDEDTDLGCGTNQSSQRGCGFGFEGWDDITGRESLKFLGSVAEYRPQTIGRLSNPPTGYQRRFLYDTRLLENISPPGFPISGNLEAKGTIRSFSTWRIASN